MSHPQVVNVRSARTGSYLYIGRRMPGFPGSIYANPFKVGIAGPRGECVEMFRRWLAGELYVEGLTEARLKIRENLPALATHLRAGGKLGCWCAPERCHGEVLVDLAMNLVAAPAGETGVGNANGGDR